MTTKQRLAEVYKIFDKANAKLRKLDLTKEELDEVRRLAGGMVVNAQLQIEELKQKSHGNSTTQTQETPTKEGKERASVEGA